MLEQGVDVASLAVLHVDFGTVAHPVTHNHRRSKGKHLGTLDVGGAHKYLSDDSILAVLLSLTLVPRLQLNDEGTGRRTLPAAHQVVSYDARIHLDLWDVFDAGFHFAHDALGLFQCATRRGGNRHEYGACIFIRYQSSLGGLHQHEERHDSSH